MITAVFQKWQGGEQILIDEEKQITNDKRPECNERVDNSTSLFWIFPVHMLWKCGPISALFYLFDCSLLHFLTTRYKFEHFKGLSFSPHQNYVSQKYISYKSSYKIVQCLSSVRSAECSTANEIDCHNNYRIPAKVK